jgi:hypothetical protein
MRLKPCLAALAVTAICVTSASAGTADDTRAAETARAFLDRSLSLGSPDLVPRQQLRSASIGEALPVRDAATLAISYRIVPVLSVGRTVGVIAVDRSGERLLWCRLAIPDGGFPAVPAAAARNALQARRVALGLAGETVEPDETGQPGEALLVQGCDKHLYWRFDSDGHSWLVDAVKPGEPLLSSLDGSDRKAITTQTRPRQTGETPEAGEGEPTPDLDQPGSFANPPAYVIPGIPYHFQIVDWYCGPASLQMVMDWLGEEIGQYDIGDVANEAPSYGCYESDMRRAAHFSGMSAALQNPALQGYNERKLGYACIDKTIFVNATQRVKNTVLAGAPVYTLTWYDQSHTSGHFRVVKGYDDSLGVFVIHDPWFFGTLCGPDLLMDQALFADDLWAYSNHWCMVLSPWILTPSFPASVSRGDTFSVSLRVLYPGPTLFSGSFPCSACRATISLPAGLALAGGGPTLALPNMDSGDTATVSWNVVAVGPQGGWEMAFQAQGVVSGSSTSYASYSDSIGGHAREEVSVGAEMLAGWGAEERLTSDPATSETCFPGARAVALGQDGTLHLVWADTRDANSEIYYRQRVGETWGAEMRLTTDPGHSHSPSIAADPQGRLHVAWVDDRAGNYEIYYKRWDPISGWSADERVTDYYEVDSRPAIAASSSSVYLAWESRVDGYYRVAAVYMAVRSAGGWSSPVEVDPSYERDRYRPSVALAADGIVHVVYERQTSDVADECEEIAHRSWNGAFWSAPVALSSSASFSRGPAIAAASDSTVHVVWQDGENIGGDIFYAWYDGSSWQPYEQVVTGADEAGTPSVAADGTGKVHVAWSDNRHGESEIYLATRHQGTWSSPARLSAAAGASMLPAVATGPFGEVGVVWTDLRNGNADLYFRCQGGDAGVPWGPQVVAGGPAEVSPAWPDPFAGQTRIRLSVAHQCPAEVRIFDVCGRFVAELYSGVLDAGVREVVWDGTLERGTSAAPGVYFVSCRFPQGRQVRRVVLVR